MRTRISVSLILRDVGITVALLLALFPIYWIVTTSFKNRLDVFSVPPVWIFRPVIEAYKRVITGQMGVGYEIDFLPSLITTGIITSTVTLISVSIGSLCAYGLSRFKIRGGAYLPIILLSTRMIPTISYAFPLYMIMEELHMVDTYFALILSYTAFSLPYSIWIMLGFFRGIPHALDDSAMIDGCTRLSAFFRVILPVSKPGIAAASTFCFLVAWQEFLMALLLGGAKIRPLTLTVSLFVGQREIYWNEMAAASSILMIPVFLILVALQKYLVRGIVGCGEIKG